MAKLGRRWRRRRTPEGIRITKVGLWYVLFTVLVAIAATNTGNNALYLVVAVMLGALLVSGVVSRFNVDRLEARIEVADEVFANQPFQISFTLRNRSRLFAHWFLLVSAASGTASRTDRGGAPRLVPYLPRRGVGRGRLEMLFSRRGVHRIRGVQVSTLFPFGFFRKGVRYHVEEEILVYPELYLAAAEGAERPGRLGEQSAARSGWGHGLHSLRTFRQGDDPRGIHWKQTARTGEVIYMEREAEESRRLAILFDNGVGPLRDAESRERFERLVSEAATTAVDHLERGFEVELVTRDRRLPFGRGRRHRHALLEALALVEPSGAEPGRALPAGAVARTGAVALHSSDPTAPSLRLTLDRGAEPGARPGTSPVGEALAGRGGRGRPGPRRGREGAA